MERNSALPFSTQSPSENVWRATECAGEYDSLFTCFIQLKLGQDSSSFPLAHLHLEGICWILEVSHGRVGLLPEVTNTSATPTEKQRFVQLAISDIFHSLFPLPGNLPNQWLPRIKEGELNINVGQDNEVTVAPPVVRQSVDVVSLSFKLELIVLFRRRSVWLLNSKG